MSITEPMEKLFAITTEEQRANLRKLADYLCDDWDHRKFFTMKAFSEYGVSPEDRGLIQFNNESFKLTEECDEAIRMVVRKLEVLKLRVEERKIEGLQDEFSIQEKNLAELLSSFSRTRTGLRYSMLLDGIGVTDCGTAGCAAGYGPYAGVPKKPEEAWADYIERVFLSSPRPQRVWDWLFGSFWSSVDNTPYGAGLRIHYFLRRGVDSVVGQGTTGDVPNRIVRGKGSRGRTLIEYDTPLPYRTREFIEEVGIDYNSWITCPPGRIYVSE